MALVALAVLAGEALAAPRPPACDGGRFVVVGSPLLPGAPAGQRDVVTLAREPAAAELSVGCGAAALKGTPKLKAAKKGTKVSATWRDCAGVSGKVRLKGMLVESCGRLRATLRAQGIKKTFEAPASACGDGFVDAARDEACDVGADCPAELTCTLDCTCVATATTTTVSDTTTTTTTTVPGPCNPLAAPGAQGCPAGERCTWIVVTDTPEQIGQLGCVPDGPQGLNQACMRGPAGETTGYDDCAAGLVCVDNLCLDICGFDGSPSAACSSGYYCTRYSGLFANGDDDPVAGACLVGCNPLTQLTTENVPCGAGRGCYLLTSSSATIAVCAAAGTIGHGALIPGVASANSCLPRHMPRLRMLGSSQVECGALCQVTDVYQGVNEASEGGVAPDTCVAAGAAAPDDAMNGESCRYWWAREPFEELSEFSNTVGWCFRHAAFTYDTNGDMTPDAPFPRCPSLTTGDVVPPIGNPPHNDALYFWCVAQPAPLPPPAALRLHRLVDPTRQR